ncbi:helix-turn-helix domain-containing protein [Paenibacillus ehimensis]|uniref:helix-turn-helix domain-containing protein n=1 Tax=Paenibacillus ehimensis TaxID=79264 RepID=UPI000472DB0B|nr:helix-turn-helix domain-containing protein [Paenibacillus ehimensis]
MFSYNPLWKLLIDKGMKKEDYRLAIGMGRSTLAKMGKNEYVSMEILDKTCTLFGVQLSDIVEHLPQADE